MEHLGVYWLLLHRKAHLKNQPGVTVVLHFQAITIIGGSDGTAPAQLKVYTNREDLDFSTVAQLPPVQQWDLQENLNGQIEYHTQ